MTKIWEQPEGYNKIIKSNTNLNLPKGSSSNVVGLARNPYFLHRSLRDFTSSSRSV